MKNCLYPTMQKPYCGNGNEVPENCIELKNCCLTIRDVRSPTGEEYDCIWEQEDIESVLDKLGKAAAYTIKKVSCDSVTQLVIPSVCMAVAWNAFDECSALRELICFGEILPELKNSSVKVVGAEEYIRDLGAVIYHEGIERIYTEPGYVLTGIIITSKCTEISENDIRDSKRVFFHNRDAFIERGSITPSALIIGFSDSTAEEYARKNGNEWRYENLLCRSLQDRNQKVRLLLYL